MRWAPWHRYKDAEDVDGDIPEGVPVEERNAGDSAAPSGDKPPIIIETKNVPPRDFYISKKDAEKHGYTKGCGGCSS